MGRCSSTSRSTCSARRPATCRPSTRRPGAASSPIPTPIARLAELVAGAERPAFIVGSDVYWAGAEDALAAAVEHLRVPVFTNGLGRGTLPADHELAFLRTRGLLKQRADVVVVLGTPLDFRLGFGRFGAATVAHVVDAESQRAAHVDVLTVAGDIAATLRGARRQLAGARATTRRGSPSCATPRRRRGPTRRRCWRPPAGRSSRRRIYGELRKRLARDAVVDLRRRRLRLLRRQVRRGVPARRAGSTPARTAASATGSGYSIAARVARPDAQIVTLLGDGAAGFSLMDADSLVRHGLPVVMVVGNNGMWGLEKHPMQAIYGWDVACDLQPGCRYDEVVTALGGGGELVTDPEEIGPALDRAFASGVPYLVNVVTDPTDVYPRSSNLG